MARQKFLLIEDDKDDAFLLARALKSVARKRKIDLEIDHRGNGQEGLAIISRGGMMGERPDIVIVDLNMPVMDGMTFLRALRKDDEWGRWTIRAVVLTTSEERAIHEAAVRAGAERVYVKPNTLGELDTIAEELIGLNA